MVQIMVRAVCGGRAPVLRTRPLAARPPPFYFTSPGPVHVPGRAGYRPGRLAAPPARRCRFRVHKCTSRVSRKKQLNRNPTRLRSFDLSTVSEGRRFQQAERRCRLRNSAHAELIALALEFYYLVLQRCLHRSEFHMNDSLDHWQCNKAPSARNPYVIAD